MVAVKYFADGRRRTSNVTMRDVNISINRLFKSRVLLFGYAIIVCCELWWRLDDITHMDDWQDIAADSVRVALKWPRSYTL